MTFLPALKLNELTSPACHMNGMYFGRYNDDQQFALNVPPPPPDTCYILKLLSPDLSDACVKTASTIIHLNNCSFKNMRHSIRE